MTRRGLVPRGWAPAAVALATLVVLAVVVPLLLGPGGTDEQPAAPTGRAGAGASASGEQPPLPQPGPEAVAPLTPPELEAAATLTPPRPSSAPTAGRAGPHTIAGRVVRAADGTPLAGAIVRAMPGDDGPVAAPVAGPVAETDAEPADETDAETDDEAVAETDADGRFELPLQAAADRLEVRYSVDRSWPHAPQSFALSGDSADDLRLVYDSGFTLAGTVRNEQDRPLPHAQVGVLVSGSQLWSSLWVTADAEGRYAVPDLAPPPGLGAISVSAQAAGHCPISASLPLAGTAPGVRTLDLHLQREGAIEITVRDPAGQAAGDLLAIVRTESDQIFQGQGMRDGIVRVGRLPAGHHTVFVTPGAATRGNSRHRASTSSAEAEEHLAPARIEDVTVQPGRITPLAVTLQAGATVSGRVTDASGLPLKDAQVWFELVQHGPEPAPSELSPHRRHDQATARLQLRNAGARTVRVTGADGQFELLGLPAGRVRIVAHDDDHVLASTELDLGPGESRGRVDFALRPGLSLAGNVRLADGSAMQFCTKVFVLPADPDSDEVLAVSETAFEGAFVAEGLEPGPKRLLVVGADGSWVEATVEPGGEAQTFVAR